MGLWTLDLQRFLPCSKIFKIVKFYNKIEFVEQNTSFYFNPESELSKSADANISESVISSVKLKQRTKKKGFT